MTTRTMTHNGVACESQHSPTSTAASAVARFRQAIAERREQRIAIANLRSMDEHMLQDIGWSRNTVDAAVLGKD